MKPKIKTTCTKLQLHLLSFCLLCLSGKTRCDGNGPAVVKVEQDSDAVLPCSLSSTENIESYRFEWKKAAQIDGRQKEVFFYDAGITYDSGRSGQSEEFKGRVSHFQDELKQGNASIIIRNTKMADSGDYTCDFPRLQPPQTFHIKLVVGTCPKPYLRILRPTTDGMLLQCVVRGASPKPKVEWKDSSGKILLAEEPQVTDRGGLYDIILQTTVTKTDNYSCVSTQEEICHQISDDTHVSVNEPVVVTVTQDRDALLPCSLSTKENIEQGHFDWNKVAQNNEKQKEVFQYLNGRHSNTGYGSQDKEFKDRVSHFQEELKHANASIIIRNTKVADSGEYTCTFTEPRQTFHIKLVVGAAPKPNIEHLDQTDNRALLQCEANGNPQPEVEWRDSAGNTLPAEEPQVTERDGCFYVTLNTAVNKTDRYRCVATQKNISHQIYAETFVRLNDRVLKDRSDENIRGAAKKPFITALEQTKDWSRLQCEVQDASPKPKVEWKDSSGNKLPAEEPQVTDKGGGSYDIILQTTVTKTDHYHCVVTQEDINHQTEATIHVYISGATSKPNIRILDQTDNWALLQCEANGNPQPEVEWRDSAGNKLPAEEPQVTERDGRFYVTLNTTVTKTDRYYCVVTQRTINHQIHDETFVRISVERGNSGSGANSSDPPTGRTGVVVGVIVTLVCTLLVVGVVLAVLFYKRHIILNRNNGSPADHKEGSAVPLKSQPSQSQEAPDPET